MTTPADPTAPWPAGAVNPVLPGFHPDPTCCRVDGPDGTWFYLVTSTFEYLPGLPVFRSRDLVGWELIGHVLDRPEQVDLRAVRDSGGLYAPTLRYDAARSRFVLVCTVVDGPVGAAGNFVVTASDPAGPWSEPIWWGGEGIDPSLLIDDHGRWWAHGTRLVEELWPQQTSVWVRELDPETLLPMGPETVIWNGALIGAIWAEGPHLYRRGEHVYLLAAEGGTGFDHAVVVARAPAPTGPFVGCPRNPVLTHRHLGPDAALINVGHAELVDHPDGSSWAVLLASRPAEGGSDLLGRETHLVPVRWVDGWPVFAPGVGLVLPNPALPSNAVLPARPSVEETIAVRRLPAEVGALDADGRAVLRPGPDLSERLPAFLGRRIRSVNERLEVALDAVPAGVRAGVAVRYCGTAWVSVESDGAQVTVRRGGPDGVEVLARAAATLPGRARLELDGTTARAVWADVDGERVVHERVDLSALCATRSGGFVGIVGGVVAVGDPSAGEVALRFTTG